MVSINSEIICNIILKARSFQIEQDFEIPAEKNTDTEFEQELDLAEYSTQLTYIELKNMIDDLEPDQQETVIALMYIGRGDYPKNQWIIALNQARTIPIANRADYLITKPLLADYLQEGLEQFGYSCDI